MNNAHVTTGPRLVIREGASPLREVALGKTPLAIGRDPSANIPIGLPNEYNKVGLPDISRHHAQITPTDDGYTIVDLGSKNGTRLRGRQLLPNQPAQLQNGDVIRIGDPYGNMVSLTYMEGAAMVEAGVATVSLTQEQLTTLARISIGRNPKSVVFLDSPLVSWNHAELVRVNGGHQLVDLRSTNGTLLNGRPVQQTMLKDGDIIQIGPFKMNYSPGGMVSLSQLIRLDAVQLFKSVPTAKGTRVLINNISLSILPREFVVLVGGSGAGKSTLMDALNGSRPAHKGQVLVNGENLYKHFDAYRSDMGYVPQSDILHTTLSVRSALTYTAMLRLPPDTRKEEIQHRIDDVLQMVDMTEQKDLQIARLSGGQRKRVSIASEMLSNPSLLFLDEPTSGLDPGLDKKMMTTLNNLADTGRTVILTTHATTNILGSCDQIIFLSHGRLVYYGPPQQAMTFFQSNDFATIYSKVETSAQAEAAEERYAGSPDFQQYIQSRLASIPKPTTGSSTGPKPKSAKRRKGLLRQFFILSRRYLDLIINDRLSLFVLSAVMPIIGIFLLVIANPMALVGDSESVINSIIKNEDAYQIVPDSQRLILMLALSSFLLGVFAAAYEIIKERPVYERERMINLGIAPYVLSKVTVLGGFGILQCLLVLLVVGVRVDYPTSGLLLTPFLEMYITLLLSLLAGVGIGLLLSALIKSSSTTIYLVLVVLFIQMIFCGALFPLPDIAEPVSYLTPTRWALEGLGASINMDALNDLGRTYIKPLQQTVLTRMEFHVNYEHTPEHLLLAWGMLLAFIVVSLAATMFALRRQDVH